MLLSLLCKVFESWPRALCFCKFAEDLWVQNTTKPDTLCWCQQQCAVAGCKGESSSGRAWLPGKHCFDVKPDGVSVVFCFEISGFAQIQETREEGNHKQMKTYPTNKQSLHKLPCAQSGEKCNPGLSHWDPAEEPCREPGHVDSGRPTNLAPWADGKGNRNSKQNHALQKFFLFLFFLK